MRKFRYIIAGLLIYFSSLCFAFGQSTTVTATVIDASGQAWVSGTVTAKYRQPFGNPNLPFWNGTKMPDANKLISGTLNTSGLFSISVPSNNFIVPSGSQWDFTVCPNASAQCYTTTLTISGATQDVSASIIPPAINVNSTTFPVAYNDAQVQTQFNNGAIYYNTLQKALRLYNGVNWGNIYEGNVFYIPGTSSDVFADANNAIVSLNLNVGGSRGGKIIIPKGSYTTATPLIADGTSGIDISCASNGEGGGGNAPTVINYTGTTTPISARSAGGFHLHGCVIFWNNPAFVGPVVDLSHSATVLQCGGLACDAVFAEIDHNQFRATGSGALANYVIYADKLISSTIHDNVFAGYQYGIVGAIASGSYSNVIQVTRNHFDNSSGTCQNGAHLVNLGNSWEINDNTFEMGSGTCALVGQLGSFSSALGVHIVGNWVGDNPAGDVLNFITVNGGGWSVTGNFFAGGSSNLSTLFNFSGFGGAFVAEGNWIQNFATVSNLTTGLNGISIKNNRLVNVTNVLGANPPLGGDIGDSTNVQTKYGALVFKGSTTPSFTSTQFSSGGFGLYGFSGSPTAGVIIIGDGSSNKQLEWGTFDGIYHFKGALNENGNVTLTTGTLSGVNASFSGGLTAATFGTVASTGSGTFKGLISNAPALGQSNGLIIRSSDNATTSDNLQLGFTTEGSNPIITMSVGGTCCSGNISIARVQFPSNMTTITTTAAASDAATIAGVSASSKCLFSATNATAAGLTGVFITPTTNTVTLSHSASAGGTFTVFCSL